MEERHGGSGGGATGLVLTNADTIHGKWRDVKLGRCKSRDDHRVVLDSIDPNYTLGQPNARATLKKRVGNPYAQSFPRLERSSKAIGTPCRRHRRTLHSLPQEPSHVIGFRDLVILSPMTKSKSIKGETTRPTAQHDLENAALKAKRQDACRRLELQARAAYRLTKLEKSGATLKPDLSDKDFHGAIQTLTSLAHDYALLGDKAEASKYECFRRRALGDRHMQTFLKNIMLQLYDDAVTAFQAACWQFQALSSLKEAATTASLHRDEIDSIVHADDERFALLQLDATRVVHAFAAHAARSSLSHAYAAVAEAKSTPLSMHIRSACEMLSIAYAAFAWLDLDTAHLGLVHSSIDAALYQAELRAALARLARTRHDALETEYSQHRADFHRQAERILDLSKQAEALRLNNKDGAGAFSLNTPLPHRVLASNIEKRAMAAVVQVLHSDGGNFVVRSHAQNAREHEMAKGLARMAARRQGRTLAPVPVSLDNALDTLVATKMAKNAAELASETRAFDMASALFDGKLAQMQSTEAWKRAVHESEAMDEEGMRSQAVEANDAPNYRQKAVIANYVHQICTSSVRRVMRSFTAKQQRYKPHRQLHDDENEAQDRLAQEFFAVDVERQRLTILHEIESCRALFAKRQADCDDHIRKLCWKLHERAVHDEAKEDFVYDRMLS
ncbi:hypothetical protein AC1031_009034 [Aphanomyces cochlioides]|nr:hypothetical protein AC1031_009034 [Aphanomyces cochlioides]